VKCVIYRRDRSTLIVAPDTAPVGSCAAARQASQSDRGPQLAHAASSPPACQICRTERPASAPPDHGDESKQLVLNGMRSNGLPSMADPGETGWPGAKVVRSY